MTPDYAACLSAARPDAAWSMSGNDLSTLVWMAEGNPPSQAELDVAWPQVQYEREYAAVEAARRTLYQMETDGMFFAAQRDGGDLTAWTAAVDAIKAGLPYPTAP
jgi:hypothetical protein